MHLNITAHLQKQYIFPSLLPSHFGAWRITHYTASLCNSTSVNQIVFTAPFNNMRTLKLKAHPTNSFFATVSQTFGCSSQHPTTAERAVMKSLSTVQTTKQYTAVVGNCEELPNIWLTVAKNDFVGWALNIRVHMLLKGAIIRSCHTDMCVWVFHACMRCFMRKVVHYLQGNFFEVFVSERCVSYVVYILAK